MSASRCFSAAASAYSPRSTAAVLATRMSVSCSVSLVSLSTLRIDDDAADAPSRANAQCAIS